MRTKLKLAKFTQSRLENITKNYPEHLAFLKAIQVLMLIIEMKFFFYLCICCILYKNL